LALALWTVIFGIALWRAESCWLWIDGLWIYLYFTWIGLFLAAACSDLWTNHETKRLLKKPELEPPTGQAPSSTDLGVRNG